MIILAHFVCHLAALESFQSFEWRQLWRSYEMQKMKLCAQDEKYYATKNLLL